MKEKKVFELKTNWSVDKVCLVKSTYRNNGTLYVGLECEDGEPFDTITTNITHLGATNTCAYVQMGNEYGYDKVAWLIQNGIATSMGIVGHSGWNTYMLMDFSESLSDMRVRR